MNPASKRGRELLRPPAGRCITAFALFFLAWFPIEAHRLESALTTIDSNDRTGQLEIIHEIYHHDLEHVVSQNRGELIDLTSDVEALEEAVRWLGGQFRLTDGNDLELALTCVGAELERGRLLIYFETEQPENLRTLKVFDQILMESISQQVNRVNIRIGGPTETLVFRRGVLWQQVDIPTSR